MFTFAGKILLMKENFNILSLKEEACKVLPKGGSVWLYGSRARGDAHNDSDWDLLILIDKQEVESSDFDSIGFPFIEYGWHFGADISPQIYTHKEWERMKNTPYHSNVEHDKIVIYES